MLDIGRFYWDRRQAVGSVAGALDKGCRAEHVHPREENLEHDHSILVSFHLPCVVLVHQRERLIRESPPASPWWNCWWRCAFPCCSSGVSFSLFGTLGESVNNSKSNSENATDHAAHCKAVAKRSGQCLARSRSCANDESTPRGFLNMSKARKTTRGPI